MLSVDGITTGFKDVAILCPLGAFCAKNVALPVFLADWDDGAWRRQTPEEAARSCKSFKRCERRGGHGRTLAQFAGQPQYTHAREHGQ